MNITPLKEENKKEVKKDVTKLLSNNLINDDQPVVIKQHQNGSEAKTPPKPMPRSRGSLSDSSDGPENNGVITPPRPAARAKPAVANNAFNNYSNSAFKVS